MTAFLRVTIQCEVSETLMHLFVFIHMHNVSIYIKDVCMNVDVNVGRERERVEGLLYLTFMTIIAR